MSSKLTKSHRTLIEPAKKIRRWAERFPFITKISAGIIKQARSAKPTVKVKYEPACLLLIIKAATTLQEVRLYHSFEDRDGLVSSLREFATDESLHFVLST